ncbi:TetR family transcriptional regulator [Streptomyces sp. NA02950]|uniref:TetR family transcriptional regulator n=1 Tax=Streptomyces sp. NA02950 TaxID=2742137 RepID=UPI0020CB0F56|nr:TetR family transcriptional regulator [Streptomyces sp. NA02950]
MLTTETTTEHSVTAEQSAKRTTRPSFTETGRRAQIVAAAIDIIAEAGYQPGLVRKIAEHAGLSSTGMISYHFHGRDDLMREVVAEVMRLAEGYVRPPYRGPRELRGPPACLHRGRPRPVRRVPEPPRGGRRDPRQPRGDDPGMVAFLGMT